MLQARWDSDAMEPFVLYADAIARRLILRDRANLSDPQRRRARAAALSRIRRDRSDPADRFDDVEWQITVRQSLTRRRLDPNEHRAIALIMRGGPYDNFERAVMFRARKKLRARLEGTAEVLALAWMRIRGWLDDTRPAVTSVAAVMTVASLGGLAHLPGSEPTPTHSVRLGTSSPTESSRPVPAAATPVPLAARAEFDAEPRTPPKAAADELGRSHQQPPVVTETGARLPRPGDPGEATMTVRVLPSVEGHPWLALSADLSCDSMVSGAVCAAAQPLGQDDRP